MTRSIDINCDCGESFGNWQLGADDAILPLITTANVACGFHGGDPMVMRRTVEIAASNGVAVGAHPGLPDLVGFGRRKMDISADDAYAMVVYQVGALKAFLEASGMSLHHVKPHGALYVMLHDQEEVAAAVAEAIRDTCPAPLLYWPAPVEMHALPRAARKLGIEVVGEVYFDLGYSDEAKLIVERKKTREGPRRRRPPSPPLPRRGRDRIDLGQGHSAGSRDDLRPRRRTQLGRSDQDHPHCARRGRRRGGGVAGASQRRPAEGKRMIYDEPIYRPLGDCYLAVEFGDEADLSLNFKVLALADALKKAEVPGIIEIIPSFRELGLLFDRFETDHEALKQAVIPIQAAVADVETLPSRLVELPLWYDDPWSAELAKRFNVQKNIDFVAECNGITVDEVIARHTGTDYWIVCVGFTPGCYFSLPLDPASG